MRNMSVLRVTRTTRVTRTMRLTRVMCLPSYLECLSHQDSENIAHQ